MKKLSCSGRVHPFFLIIIILLVSIPMGFYGMYLYIAPSLPDMSTLKKAPLLKPLQVYSSDEHLIAEYGGKLSLPVDYNEIPTHFIHAFLAAEDSAFFEHSGVSFKSLGRAVSESLTGSDVQTGGSTITMQVAKNYYLSPERSLKRKLTEVFLARKIEQNLTKEEILTLYVNKIFLGKNAYGIAAAAEIYYDKTLSELTLAQMAMISGLPKAPSRFNPVVNPERALERRNWILGRMLQLGSIDQNQYQEAIAEPINLNMPKRNFVNRFPYIGEIVRAELVSRFGEQVVDSGYKVYTTINSQRQSYAETAVQEGLEAYDRRHGWRGVEAHDKPLSDFVAFANTYPAQVTQVYQNSFAAILQDGTEVIIPWSGMSWIRPYRNANSVGGGYSRASQIVKIKDIVRLRPNADQSSWSLVQVPKVQGQLIALNPNNGAVEALVGGYSFYHSKFNRATQGWRQPGSIIKPFVYALALEQGMTPHSMISDNPIRIGKWSPRNSDGRYLGMMPLRRALYLSRNTVSVRLLQSVGLERTRQLFMDFGLQDDQIPRNYTIALGTPQVLPIQMATGYATFANGGYRVQPYFIEKIEDNNGLLLYQAKPEYACIRCAYPNAKLVPLTASNTEQAASEASASETSTSEAQPLDIAASETSTSEAQVTEPKQSSDQTTVLTTDSGQYRQAPRILKSSSAYDMANILRDVILVGTGRAALKIGRDDLGGKTGTTNDAKDAWFAGFNAKLVTVTWVGFDQPATLGRREYGGVAALPIWSDFMSKALQDTPSAWVSLDPNAKAPVSREPKEVEETTPKRPEGKLPPVAYPLYRPQVRTNEIPTATSSAVTERAPPPVPKKPSNDFEDLPIEVERPLQPVETPPPMMKSQQQQDSLDDLINQLQ